MTSYEGAIGIKTGFTGNAGYCFVGAINRDEKKLVSVVLASGWPPHKTYKWKDTTCLMDYGVKEYNLKEILAEETTFQQIPVKNSIEAEPVTPYNQDSVSLLLKEDENVSFDVKLPTTLDAPVKQGQTIGNLTIKIDGEIYLMIPLYSKDTRRKITYEYVLKNILLQYLGWKVS